MDLGSGPIMKASSGAGDDRGAAQVGYNRASDSGIGNVVFSVTKHKHTQKIGLEQLQECIWRKVVFSVYRNFSHSALILSMKMQ